MKAKRLIMESQIKQGEPNQCFYLTVNCNSYYPDETDKLKEVIV